jgi:hypothetical protein
MPADGESNIPVLDSFLSLKVAYYFADSENKNAVCIPNFRIKDKQKTHFAGVLFVSTDKITGIFD